MKLIDKDALVAKIEKLKRTVDDSSSYCIGWQHALRMLELSLGTLEVKEVDLEKEISFQWSKFCLNGRDRDSFVKVAKHFFELGMAVSNKAQKGE